MMLHPFVVLCSGSPGRNGWLEGNGPKDIVWSSSQEEAYQMARLQYWPHTVRVEHMLKTCEFYAKLLEDVDDWWKE